jgi:hypothetical protein
MPSNSLLSMRMISEDSLLTIRPAGLGLEAGRAVRRDTVAEAAIGAAELATGAGFLGKLAIPPRPVDENAHCASDLADCGRQRSVKSLGNSSLVSSLKEKFAKIQPVLVILKLKRK